MLTAKNSVLKEDKVGLIRGYLRVSLALCWLIVASQHFKKQTRGFHLRKCCLVARCLTETAASLYFLGHMYQLVLLTSEETHIFSLAFMSFHVQFSHREILVSHSIMRII